MQFKITITDNEEVISFDMPENSEITLIIKDKEVKISNEIKSYGGNNTI